MLPRVTTLNNSVLPPARRAFLTRGPRPEHPGTLRRGQPTPYTRLPSVLPTLPTAGCVCGPTLRPAASPLCDVPSRRGPVDFSVRDGDRKRPLNDVRGSGPVDRRDADEGGTEGVGVNAVPVARHTDVRAAVAGGHVGDAVGQTAPVVRADTSRRNGELWDVQCRAPVRRRDRTCTHVRATHKPPGTRGSTRLKRTGRSLDQDALPHTQSRTSGERSRLYLPPSPLRSQAKNHPRPGGRPSAYVCHHGQTPAPTPHGATRLKREEMGSLDVTDRVS